MRLIDADALKRKLEGRTYRAKGKFIEMIDDMPTIEAEPTMEQINNYCEKRNLTILTNDLFYHLQKQAEPVKRGKRKVYYHGEATFSYMCGVCGMPIDHNDAYCRWCGAKLEGAEE